MAGTSVDILATYFNQLQDALKQLNDAKIKANSQLAITTEVQRQVDYHKALNHTADFELGSKRLIQEKGFQLEADNKVKELQKLYDDSERLFLEKKTLLLSADEQKQFENKIDAENQLLKTKADTQKIANDEATAKLFAQKNTQYIIYSVIGVAVLLVGFVIYKTIANK